MIYSTDLKQKFFVLESEKDNYLDSKGWNKVSSPAADASNIVINGREYSVIEVKEKYLPLLSFERVARIVVGLFFTVITLGFALRYEAIRACFSGRQVVSIIKPFSKEVPLPKERPPTLPKEPKEVPPPPPKEVPPPSPKDVVSWKPAGKFFILANMKTLDPFVPLTNEQAKALLDKEPKLRDLDAAQGKLKAYGSILAIHQVGIPERLIGAANTELKFCMQFILYKISQESNLKKQKELLLEVAQCVEDCTPVTQGSLAKMHCRLASIGGLNSQLEQFIFAYKDKIVNEVIYELFPGMKDPGYALKNHPNPPMQFPHMKTGFLAILGAELGLQTTGALDDPNRNTKEVFAKKEQFKKLFHQKVSIHEVIREFIIDVNGRNGQIDIKTLTDWCIPENLGEEANNVSYDKDFTYPSYSPEYKKEYGYEPYLMEKTAYLIFEKLGYISRK